MRVLVPCMYLSEVGIPTYWPRADQPQFKRDQRVPKEGRRTLVWDKLLYTLFVILIIIHLLLCIDYYQQIHPPPSNHPDKSLNRFLWVAFLLYCFKEYKMRGIFFKVSNWNIYIGSNNYNATVNNFLLLEKDNYYCFYILVSICRCVDNNNNNIVGFIQ